MSGRNWALLALAIVGLALGVWGCATQARVEMKYAEKLAAWRAEHPNQEPTAAEQEQISAEAIAEVKREVAEERKDAIAKGADAAGHAASGNWLMLAWDLVGLIGLAAGVGKVA